MPDLILASTSPVRAQLLRNAGLEMETVAPRVDEESIKQSLQGVDAKPRDVADALAQEKARKVAGKWDNALVLGCDQVLEVSGQMLSKPSDETEAISHLTRMRGTSHTLYSAAVFYEGPAPVWRHVGKTTLHMRDLSDAYIEGYIRRNWDSIRYCGGCYKIEEEGARLFTRIEGDYFTILGLPLLEVLSYLTLRGTLQS